MSLAWSPWVILQIATEIGEFLCGAKQMHRAARSYHSVHRRLLYRSLGPGPHGHSSSQNGGTGGWGQNPNQAFQLQPLVSEVIFHVFSVSTRFNVSLMLNTQNLNSYDEPSRPEQWCLPSRTVVLSWNFCWVQESSLSLRLCFILYIHELLVLGEDCPVSEVMSPDLWEAEDIVSQRVGSNASSDLACLCGFGL